MTRDSTVEMPVVTAAISRTASGRRRAVNMMSSAPTNGIQVMRDRMGTRKGLPQLRPDEQEQHAERHAIHVVLRLAGLQPSRGVARAKREGRERVEHAVDDVTVDPPDDA